MLYDMSGSVEGEENPLDNEGIREAIERAIADAEYMDEVAAPIADDYLTEQFGVDVDTGTCPYCGEASECKQHGCCKECHVVHFIDNINSENEMAKFLAANIVMAVYHNNLGDAVAGALAILKVEEFYEGWKEWAEQKIRGEDPPMPFGEDVFS